MFMKNIFYDHIDYSLLFCWCRCWILQHFQNQSLICQFSAETLFQLQSWTLLFCELWRLNLHLLATLCKHTSFTACFIYRITIPFFPREFFHFPEESLSRIHLWPIFMDFSTVFKVVYWSQYISLNVMYRDLNPLHDVTKKQEYKEKYYDTLLPLGQKYIEVQITWFFCKICSPHISFNISWSYLRKIARWTFNSRSYAAFTLGQQDNKWIFEIFFTNCDMDKV